MKQKEPVFNVGDIVCVVSPTMAINSKPNDETKKLDLEEVYLVGDEGLIVLNVEYVKKTNEYLYQVLTENGEDAKMFSLSEEQLTLF
jgi:hypothetical protein